MKKYLILAISGVISLGASAQLISSNMITKEAKEKSGYHRIGISYSSFSYGEQKDYETLGTVSGISVEWLKGISLPSSLPLYIETGLGINLGWKSKSYNETYDESYGSRKEIYEYEISEKFTYLDLRIPVNVTYRYEVKDDLKISPFIGLYLKGNILGNIKAEMTEYLNGHENEYEEESISIYSEDDCGGYKATRFNIGIDFGVNVDWQKFYLGISYAKDFNKFYDYKKAGSMGKFSITLGYTY